jgi:hypothetical protein
MKSQDQTIMNGNLAMTNAAIKHFFESKNIENTNQGLIGMKASLNVQMLYYGKVILYKSKKWLYLVNIEQNEIS